MDALFGNRPIKMEALTNFSQLSKPVKSHLRNVYTCLAISLLAASAGSYIYLYTHMLESGILILLASIGLLMWLALTPHTPENLTKRMGIFCGFAFTTGVSLGPLLEVCLDLNPSIVVSAFMATCLVFTCFTMAALLAEQRIFLYMGGVLFSGLSLLMVAGLVNIFFRSQILFDLRLYGGLAIFCLFVLYDTQLIIERRQNGDDDFVWHCVDLFLDFINIFRRLLIIFGNKEEKKRRKD